MHLTASLTANPYLHRTDSAPKLSTALFGSRYWIATLILSIAIHLLILYGLPWLNPINLTPAGMQHITASFKVLPSPIQATAEPLPTIPPVPDTPIEPLPEPVKPTPIKPIQKQAEPPKAEPVLQSTERATAEEFAIVEQTPDTTADTTTDTTEITPTPPATATPSAATNQQAKAASSATTNTNDKTNNNPITTPSRAARTNQDSGLLDAYGRDLQRLCERHKQYPSIAIRRNLEGAGTVLVTFNQDGSINSINIEQSTGEQSLDDQAIKMVEKSLRALPLPAKLNGQVLTLSVPVSFRLDN
jgi:periplasmic protein TonB